MSKPTSKFKPFFFALIGVLSTLGVLSLSHVGPASAQTPGVNLAQLVAQVNALQSTVTSQGNTITSQGNTISTLKSQQATDEQTITNLKLQEQTDIKTTQSQERNDFTKLNDTLTSQGNILASQGTNITALQTLTDPLSLSSDPNVGGTNTLLTIKGVNVQIVSGSGLTDDGTRGEVNNAKLTGLGNLILGYNRAGNSQGKGDIRTGSHNLILGDYNNYSSFGGLVAGNDNAVSGAYASVSGGADNTASGYTTSVSGGFSNTASGNAASVSGGVGNTASGNGASVSGGINITQNSLYGWSGGSYHSP